MAFAASLLALGCKSPGEPVRPAEGVETPSTETRPTAEAPEEGEAVDLQGAGATFPFPLYSKWVAEFQEVQPHVRINYQSIGSGGGIRQIIEKTVDFGASDAPMNDEETAKAPGKIIHIPTTLGAVVVGYNVADVQELKLTPEVTAGMFSGAIEKWNDPRIAKLNPGAKLPAADITVVYRSDGSGTTAVFTEYLSKVSSEWKEKVGAGKSVSFPVGVGAKGNEGVAGQLKTSPGTLGYVELAYANQTHISYATIENAAKQFVAPSLDGASAAASAAAPAMPGDMRVSLVNAAGETAYPIASFTYVLVYEEQSDAVKGKALAEFLWWAVHDGQRFGPPLDYAKLPPEVVSKVGAKLKGLRAGGQQLLAGL